MAITWNRYSLSTLYGILISDKHLITDNEISNWSSI